MKKHIGIILGSLREGSYSHALQLAIQGLALEHLAFTEINIADLPLFNPDSDKPNCRPESYDRFRQEVARQDGFIFITPEYNRTIPAALKNAIEVGSRPMEAIPFSGKPAMIISQSTGSIAGFAANHHLRQSLVFLNVMVMSQPEVYLSEIHQKITKDGQLLTQEMSNFLQAVLQDFERFVLSWSQ